MTFEDINIHHNLLASQVQVILLSTQEPGGLMACCVVACCVCVL